MLLDLAGMKESIKFTLSGSTTDFAVRAFSEYNDSVVLGTEITERMPTRTRIRGGKRAEPNCFPPYVHIYICVCAGLTNEANERIAQ